jgi:hypothetical protein
MVSSVQKGSMLLLSKTQGIRGNVSQNGPKYAGVYTTVNSIHYHNNINKY